MPENTLSPKMERAIIAILTTVTYEDAAKQARCALRTLHQWRKRDDFQARLREAYREALEAAILRAQGISNEAVTTLRAIHQDKSMSGTARVAAAKALEVHGWKAAEVGDLREDLEAVKRRITELEENQ
jgi:hypothetical protein